MNSKRLVVCDRDRDYCAALSEYIRRSDCGYEVIMYTEPKAFCMECAGNGMSLLLIQEDFLAEAERIINEGGDDCVDASGINAGRRFVLTESREAASGMDRIYKYQSAAVIISSVGEDIKAAYRIVNDMERCAGMRFTGIYSPLSHTLKTTFALTLGQILAEDREVLYVNMEGYNGLTGLMDIRSEYGLTDLIYDYSLHPKELSGMIAQYTVRISGLNVLMPARSPSELQEIDTSMWLSLLSALSETGKYAAVILDISDAVRGAMDLLNICTDIYMPVRTDAISMAKLKDFEYILSRYPGAEGIRNKLKRLKFPYFDDIGPDIGSLKNCRLGRYIRQEILT